MNTRVVEVPIASLSLTKLSGTGTKKLKTKNTRVSVFPSLDRGHPILG